MSDQVEKPRESAKGFRPNRLVKIFTIASMLVFMVILIPWYAFLNDRFHPFTDQFTILQEDSVMKRGWMVQLKDSAYWNRRAETPGMLTLFTLNGDSKPDSLRAAGIQNLMMRKINGDCFSAEIHFKHFVPTQNWQQAGIILLEDTAFSEKSLVISLAYNDLLNGEHGSKEIFIKVMASNEDLKPEEIAHFKLFKPVNDSDFPDVRKSLENAALRIEKNGSEFSFLYANGGNEKPDFKEITRKVLDVDPEYAGVFALRGFVEEAEVMPVHINLFNLIPGPCE